MNSDLSKLKKKIEALPVGQQLILAGQLCEQGKFDLAESLAEAAVKLLALQNMFKP